jgi:transcriptional regulator with XRE-family HTH domain
VAKSRADRLKLLVGRRISEVRRARNTSQEQLAGRLDVSVQWLSRVENGRENLTLETISTFAHTLGVDPRDLFIDKGDGQRLPTRVARRDAR